MYSNKKGKRISLESNAKKSFRDVTYKATLTKNREGSRNDQVALHDKASYWH
jgi:hypothetical protein